MTIIQEKKAPIIALDTNQQEEELLSWLQEFHANIIKPLGKDLSEDVPDNKIARYDSFEDVKTLNPYSLLISNIGNPGWSLKFALSNDMLSENLLAKFVIDDQVLENGAVEGNWLRSHVDEEYNILRSAGGPLCLSSVLYCFKAQIEGKKLVTIDEILYLQNIRNTLKDNNKLLTWLEDFYFSYCDGDWEHMYGSRLISIKKGWILACRIEDTILETKKFDHSIFQNDEGITECYKSIDNYYFMIKVPSRGLIEGLQIFKEWVERKLNY